MHQQKYILRKNFCNKNCRNGHTAERRKTALFSTQAHFWCICIPTALSSLLRSLHWVFWPLIYLMYRIFFYACVGLTFVWKFNCRNAIRKIDIVAIAEVCPSASAIMASIQNIFLRGYHADNFYSRNAVLCCKLLRSTILRPGRVASYSLWRHRTGRAQQHFDYLPHSYYATCTICDFLRILCNLHYLYPFSQLCNLHSICSRNYCTRKGCTRNYCMVNDCARKHFGLSLARRWHRLRRRTIFSAIKSFVFSPGNWSILSRLDFSGKSRRNISSQIFSTFCKIIYKKYNQSDYYTNYYLFLIFVQYCTFRLLMRSNKYENPLMKTPLFITIFHSIFNANLFNVYLYVAYETGCKTLIKCRNS